MFKDEQKNKIIDRLGFAKTTLGNKEMIQNLKKLYHQNFKDSLNDMTVTHNGNNYIDPLIVHNEIVKIVKPFFEKTFKDYSFLASHFVVKRKNSNNNFQLHQDWNVVDESVNNNYQIWIPLDASYPENGGLCFLPESHKFFKNYRSGSNGLPLIDLKEELHPHLSYLRLVPNEIAIFYSKTFHGSFINSTPKDRVAVLINIVEKGAQTVYYHRNSKDLIEKHSITTTEIFKYLKYLEKGEMPLKSAPLETFKTPKINLKVDNLLSKVKEFNTKKRRHKFYEHKFYDILKDETIENEVNSKGYAIINLLSEVEIEKLQIKMNAIFSNRDNFSGTFSSVSALNKEDRKKVHLFIKDTITNKLNCYFKNFKIPLSLFYSRKPDNKYLLEWHNDPSLLLNEHLEPFYALWCPLVDVNNLHGALKVIPGSHRWVNKLNLAYKIQDWHFEKQRDYLNKFGVNLSLKAGQAVIFDARLIHGSEPNKSKIYRDNIVMRICHQNSAFFNLFIKQPESKKADLYMQNEDYFFSDTLKNHIDIPETGELKGSMFLFKTKITKQIIDEKVALFKDAFS